MSNILLNPALWRDDDSNTPPSQWNATTSKYEFIGNGTVSDTASLQKNSAAVAGDVVSFSVVSDIPDNTIFVVINGSSVFNQAMTPGQTYNFTSAALQPDDTVLIGVQGAPGTYAWDTTITPTAEGGGGDGGGDPPDEEEPADPNADTYSVKGFVAFGATVNNNLDQVATLGELSIDAETYAKDRQILSNAVGSTPDTSVTISVFSSREIPSGDHKRVPAPYAEALVDIGQWCYRQSVNGIFSNDAEIFRQQILAEFNGTISNVTVGPMVQQGSMWLPASLSFYFVQDDFTHDWGADEEVFSKPRIKLWFSDAAFRAQYDEYQYEFVAPIDNLDDFFLLPAAVRTRVNAVTLTQIMQKVQTKRGPDPYTILKTINFDYHDPNDFTSTYPTNWTFLIYGGAGDNIDAIKSNLAEWILDNSTHTREEWTEIFPDIFTSTEFIITPMWTQYAVPNKTLDPGVYSPTINVQRALEVSHTTCTGTGYTNAHIDANLATVGCLFKSVGLIVVGGPQNLDGIFRFERKWKDYMTVVTSSPDFARMQPSTQAFINKLYELLQIAEEMTEFSDIPPGFTRLYRINPQGRKILYVVASVENVQYLVVAKATMEQYFPAVADPTALALTPPPSATLNTPTGSKRLMVNFAATGGVGPYEFSASSPDVASGTINPTTGYLDMIFSDFGTNTLDVTVTDANDDTFTGTYTVVCDAGGDGDA